MAVTLTANYKEIFAAETVEKIDELLEENYDLQAMITFIDEMGSEDDFIAWYETYVEMGEAIGYEAVDALIEEMGIEAVEGCDERYQGCFDNEKEFAEYFYDEMGAYHAIPDGIVVDWEATWETGLYYDFTACRDGDKYKPCHIFRDN